jgi:cupin fold WbuC family metalloprotein
MDIGAGIELHRINDEVFIAQSSIVQIGSKQIDFLKRQAAANQRRRARICAHRANQDRLHEMLIAIAADSYIHPHKHLNKVESFHIVEGSVDVVVFDDAGGVVEVIELGDAASGRSFYYRLSDSLYHTLVIHGDVLVVHEVTNGPFVREETVLAPFAPAESERDEAQAYMAVIAQAAHAWRTAHP